MLAGPLGRAEAGAAVPEAVGQPCGVRLHPVGELLDALGALEGAHRLAADHAQQPLDPFVAEVLELGGVGVERSLDVVPAHRRTDAEAGVEPSAREQVDGGEVLGQPQRVLPAQRDDRRTQLDPAGALRGRGQDRDGRGDAVLQVAVPHPGAVEAQLLAELDDPQRGLVARAAGRRRRTGRWSGSRACAVAATGRARCLLLAELGQPGHAGSRMGLQASRASSSSGEPGCSGGTRAGLSATRSDHSLMSGSEPKDAEFRMPRTFIRAQSVSELPKEDGGHSRFFSASSSRVAST